MVVLLILLSACAATAPPVETLPSHGSPQLGQARLAIITAIDAEYQAATAILPHPRESLAAGRQFSQGEVDGAPVVVVRAGLGKAQAAAATAMVIDRFSPTVILMAGSAGGLGSADMASGDIVVSQGTYQHDLGILREGRVERHAPISPLGQELPELFSSPPHLTQAMLTAAASVEFEPWLVPPACECAEDGTPRPSCTGEAKRYDRPHPKVCLGIMATGDSFLEDTNVARELVESMGAATIDMETAAVAQEAANHKIPFTAVRVIADVVSRGGNSLYFCLKPKVRRRLTAVLARLVPALLAEASHEQDSAPLSPATATPMACRPDRQPPAR